MLRWTYLLLVTVVASLVLAATTHAQEIAGLPDIECSGAVHSEGDADQSPGDENQGLQHHGHCHMATAVMPCRAAAADVLAARTSEPAGPAATVLGRWIRGPSLRPPIA
jgi:hypothetical protein